MQLTMSAVKNGNHPKTSEISISCSSQSNENLPFVSTSVFTTTATTNTANIIKTTAITDPINKSFPTVPKCDFLDKSISSTSPTYSTTMPPLAPTGFNPESPGNYVKPIMQINSTFANPLTKIRTLTNSLSVTNLSYIHVQPALPVNSSDDHKEHIKADVIPANNSTLMPNNVIVSSVLPIPTTGASTLTNTNALITNKVISQSGTSVEAKNNYTEVFCSPQVRVSHVQANDKTKFCLQPQNVIKTQPVAAKSTGVFMNEFKESKIPDLSMPGVSVPRGWSRVLEKDNITYISPNKSKIRNKEDMLQYLKVEGTCKCGLECPFKIDNVFIFDPRVPSKYDIKSHNDIGSIQCKVHRQFCEMFPSTAKLKPDRRGRKPGQKSKRKTESEESTNLERKRISLTGASPLEMFQTGMNAINALSKSSANLKSRKENSSKKEKQKLLTNSILLTRYPIVQVASSDKTSVSQSTIQKSSGIVVSANYTSNNSNFTLSSTRSLPGGSNSIPVSRSHIITNKNNAMLTNTCTPNPLPESQGDEEAGSTIFHDVKKRAKRTIGKGRGKDSIKADKKAKIKKALPNAAVHKASELQLHKIVSNQQKTIVGIPIVTGSIPSLRTITNVGAAPRQVFATQTLNAAHTAQKDINLKPHPLQTAILRQTLPQTLQTTILSQPKITTSNEINFIDQMKVLAANSNVTAISSPPPNRTVSSSNHLNEALLLNQISSNSKERNLLSYSGASSNSLLNAVRVCQENNGSVSLQLSKGSELKDLIKEEKISPQKVFNPVNHVLKSDISKGKTSNDLSAATTLYNSEKKNSTNKQKVSSFISSTAKNTVKTSISSLNNNGGQMLLFHIVSQNDISGSTNTKKTNSPLMRTYPISSQTSNGVVINKGALSQASHPFALHQTKKENNSNIHSKNSALHIQSVLPMQILPTIYSSKNINPCTNVTQIQYIKTMTPSTYQLQTKKSSLSISSSQATHLPLVHLIKSSPYVLSTTNSSVMRNVPIVTNNSYIRIAPGPLTTDSSQNHEQRKQQQEHQMLKNLQEQLFSTSNRAGSIGEVTTRDSVYITSMPVTSVVTMGDSRENQMCQPSVIKTSVRRSSNEPKYSIANFISEQVIKSYTNEFPTTSNVPINSNRPTTAATPLVPQYSRVLSTKNEVPIVNHVDKNLSANQETNNLDSSDEISLHCDERSSDIPVSGDDEFKRNSPQINEVYQRNESVDKSKSTLVENNMEEKKIIKNELLNKVVWINFTGYPSWPGKVLPELDSEKTNLPVNKVYVKWYGSYLVQAVDVSVLKLFDKNSLTLEQLKEQRNYRDNKLQASDLEKAIAEALEELEIQNKQVQN